MQKLFFLTVILFCYSTSFCQVCRQTGTILFIRNTGIIKSQGADIYMNDSLLGTIKNQQCKIIELPAGKYTFKCNIGNKMEGKTGNDIAVTVIPCKTNIVQFNLMKGKGNGIPSSGFILKMGEVTQKQTKAQLLEKRFVKKEIARHYLQLFLIEQK